MQIPHNRQLYSFRDESLCFTVVDILQWKQTGAITQALFMADNEATENTLSTVDLGFMYI